MSRSFVLACALCGLLTSILFSIPFAETLSFSVSGNPEDLAVRTVAGHSEIRWLTGRSLYLEDVGKPKLPYRVVSVLLPPGSAVGDVTFSSAGETVLLRDYPLEMATKPIAEDGTVANPSPMFDANGGDVFPPAYGRYLGAGVWHGRTIASFALFQVRVDDGRLLHSEQITLKIDVQPSSTESGAIARERKRDELAQRESEAIRRLVINPDMESRYHFAQSGPSLVVRGFRPTDYPSLEGSAVDYVIITTDALASEFQRLADFKTEKGVPTVVKTVEWIVANTRNGVDTQETIRFFLQDAYAKWGIRYALLGGDSDVLAPRRAISQFYLGGTEMPADLYFGGLDGSWNDDHDEFWGEVPDDNPDLFVEVHTGRLTVSTVSEAAVVVDKVMTYESTSDPYTDRFVAMAEVLFPSSWQGGPINLNGADIFETLLATSLSGVELQIVRMYESNDLYPGSVHLSVSEAIDALNLGYGHTYHMGHGFRYNLSAGGASILNDDVEGLVNANRYTNLHATNCSANAFEFESIGEAFLNNPNGGAVSVVGTSNTAFVTPAANYATEYYDLLFQQGITNIGETFAMSRLPWTPSAQSADNIDLWTHYTYTLLADPEMPLFTAGSIAPDVLHVANVGLGDNNILINVSSNGQAIEGVLVCLSKDDDDYQIEKTNASGNVTLPFKAESVGSISVVASGANLARRQSFITVDPLAAPFVSIADATVDDNIVGNSSGNSDGRIDAGESIELRLSLDNSGNAVSSALTAIISTSDPNVFIFDNTASFSPIAAGGTVAASDFFEITFVNTIADEHVVEFDVSIQDGSTGIWSDRFKQVVHAPKLEIIGLRIDDTPPLGNGNGVNEDNEEFRLFAELKNYGTGTANGIDAVLVDLGGGFVFIQSSDTYPDIQPFASAENVSGFHLIEIDTSVENDLEIPIVDSEGRTVIDMLELRVPQSPAAISVSHEFGSGNVTVAWGQSTSSDVTHYNVYRSLTSGGPYGKINTDPLDHAVFVDDGVAPGTTVYYVTSAVDAAGNESPFSPEFTTTSVPAQVQGFPMTLPEQTTSSPAIGDIDGDGDLEILVGSDRVYAWHHDGAELVDGDSDPQTNGVLSALGDVFAASIALARLDANPGLDIIAADLVSQNVFVFSHDGQVLPGWPQATQGGFRAAPSVGDIDDDGDLEIVLVDEAGIVYAWHHDGVEVRDGDNDGATNGVFFVTPATNVHYQTATLCDLDNDGKDEIVLPTRGGTVYALNDDGTDVAGWPFNLPGEAKGAAVAGDIDDDGLPEIVVRSTTTEVYLLNHDGSVAPGWPIFVALNSVFFAHGSMALADFDNDDKLEIVLTHHSGNESRLYVVDYQGVNFPGWPITISLDDEFTESGPIVADLDTDGALDIVLGDEGGVLNAWHADGSEMIGFPIHLNADVIRATPFVEDLDDDGDLDMALHTWERALYVLDFPATYDAGVAAWPTFQANVHRNGKIGATIPTSIDVEVALPKSAKLLQNYPNPFNPTTQIAYFVPRGTPQEVALVVYDVSGARVRQLATGTREPGRHVAAWNGNDDKGNRVASGIYFYRLVMPGFTETRKMVLLK